MMVEGAVAQDVADRFDHVLVDEYQDTNRLQASILLALKPNGRGLTVVGERESTATAGAGPLAIEQRQAGGCMHVPSNSKLTRWRSLANLQR